MINGVIPFPAEFAARYRAAGYWDDRPLREVFGELFARYPTGSRSSTARSALPTGS